MPRLIEAPVRVAALGEPPKTIDEFVGQAVHCGPGEWARYSTPEPEGAEYASICLPAFSFGLVHRDPD